MKQTAANEDFPSPSDTYTRLLLPRARDYRGYPLWHPEPIARWSHEHRTHGVRIGDVGLITAGGAFHFHFNICYEADHPINCSAGHSGSSGTDQLLNVSHVPPGFRPLAVPGPFDITSSPGIENKDGHVKSHSIRKLEPSSANQQAL